MSKTIGVVISSRIFAGVVEDHKLASPLLMFPESANEPATLREEPVETLSNRIRDLILKLDPQEAECDIGVALPGLVRDGLVEDSPNLAQLKGVRMSDILADQLAERKIQSRVVVVNDADAMAAGLAARNDQLDQVVRVWTLGYGIGFGRYPYRPGAWEGGHMVVTLDPKEKFCGCHGSGHLEGIMGYRAMRLRFLDMEPEEVFSEAKTGNRSCREFVELWHRALSAAIATSIHLDGPGPFYLTGESLQFVNMKLLQQDLWEMVKMSPLQNYTLHAAPDDHAVGIIGAADMTRILSGA